MDILLIFLFISMTDLMAVVSKREADAGTSASLKLTNQLILTAIILMLIRLL